MCTFAHCFTFGVCKCKSKQLGLTSSEYQPFFSSPRTRAHARNFLADTNKKNNLRQMRRGYDIVPPVKRIVKDDLLGEPFVEGLTPPYNYCYLSVCNKKHLYPWRCFPQQGCRVS